MGKNYLFAIKSQWLKAPGSVYFAIESYKGGTLKMT